MNVILQAKNISKNYGSEVAVKGVSLDIYEETFTAMLGHSGSGKSTLLSILSGLTTPSNGRIQYDGNVISNFSQVKLADWRRSEVGNVFQDYMLLQNLTAEENIKIGICPHRTPLSFDRIVRMLEINTILNKFPAQLSGGQKQRVAIARAVIKSPRILFCDEATGALDEENSKKVVELLHHLKSTFGVTILFTTHNQQIAKTADRILTMKNGQITSNKINEDKLAASDMIWG